MVCVGGGEGVVEDVPLVAVDLDGGFFAQGGGEVRLDVYFKRLEDRWGGVVCYGDLSDVSYELPPLQQIGR